MYVAWGKRFFDFFFSIVALIFLSPLLTIIIILIYFFDSGPIFFRHERVGNKGKKFLMLKFRSMPVGTKNLSSDKIGEVRVSWVGNIIRRTNIDELPQLFNILKNEMSIVGPRPCAPYQKKLIKYRRKNLSFYCKPGLTGLAQVNSYNDMSIQKKANFDALYKKNISLGTDLKIIFKTFSYLFKPPPIY